MKVFLAGEGPDELGDWFNHPSYRSTPPELGILEALLAHFPLQLEVAGSQTWKSIRTAQPGQFRTRETRNVSGVALQAWEAGFDALVFARDRDGDPDREDAIDRGIEEARATFPGLLIVGGVAAQQIEAWVLALLGNSGSERHADAKDVLRQTHGIDHRVAKVAAVQSANLDQLPADAASLRTWRERARSVLAAPSP